MLSFFISKVNYAIYRKKIQTKNKINTHILLGNMHCYLVYIFDNRFLLYIYIYIFCKNGIITIILLPSLFTYQYVRNTFLCQ